jgi:hypothetical protein
MPGTGGGVSSDWAGIGGVNGRDSEGAGDGAGEVDFSSGQKSADIAATCPARVVSRSSRSACAVLCSAERGLAKSAHAGRPGVGAAPKPERSSCKSGVYPCRSAGPQMGGGLPPEDIVEGCTVSAESSVIEFGESFDAVGPVVWFGLGLASAAEQEGGGCETNGPPPFRPQPQGFFAKPQKPRNEIASDKSPVSAFFASASGRRLPHLGAAARSRVQQPTKWHPPPRLLNQSKHSLYSLVTARYVIVK